ncbi:hypothetical protein E0493_15720 [Roseomonas sp. M0104]|uniref:Integrase n=1 Tax=Teichococcus coralli TaxID=2545983 RepID=A0A845BCD5_9PROT|nr:tyrosine-type recombinase/integrase [Pseudoroseomonas coralli]MXP64801.1 hypothetical protein [Pseudoroseomonas coralli]
MATVKGKAAPKRVPRSIEFRKGIWYATLDIPKPLRPQFNGQRRFFKSLETSSEKEALRRSPILVASWRSMIEKARGGDKLAARAAFFQEHLAKASSPEEREIILSLVEDEADALDVRDPYGAEEDREVQPDALRFYKLATGQLTELEPLLEPWLADRQVKDKTKVMDRQAVRLLIQHHPTTEAMTKRAASRFVMEVLRPGRDPATVNRMLTSIRRFWKWLEIHGYRPEGADIWAGLSLSIGTQSGLEDEGEGRRPFTEEEAAAFLRIVSEVSSELPLDLDILHLLATSTLRLAEACSLRCQDITVDGDIAWISVTAGKTKAAKRRFPVVEALVVEMLKRRKEASSDSFIFPELPTHTEAGGRLVKRSSAVSQRLGRYLDKHLASDSALVAGHSWRHRARTLLEHGDIPPWVADAMMGHQRPGEGLGRYSKGPSDEQLTQAAQCLKLPLN